MKLHKDPVIILSSLILILLSITSLIFNFLLNYYFVIFLISLIGLILLSISKNIFIKIKISSSLLKTINFGIIALAFLNLVLSFWDFLGADSSIFRFGLSFIVVYFIPGYVVLNLLDIKKSFKTIPFIVFSALVSWGLSAVMYTLTLWLNLSSSFFIPSVCFFISLLFIPKYLLLNSNGTGILDRPYSIKKYNVSELLTIVWIASFFVVVILSLYPQLSFTPGSDIIKHYSLLTTLQESHDTFFSKYPWYHFAMANLNNLAHFPIWLFQTGMAFMSIVLIFAFFTLSKAYLSPYGRNLHLISTLIFTSFSGFGWIYYFQNFSSVDDLLQRLILLSNSYFATYYDVGIGQSTWLWLWFRPITIGFTTLFFILYLLQIKNIGKITYVSLMSFLLLILSLNHFSEFSILLFLLFVISLFIPRIELRIKEAIISSIIALLLFAGVMITNPIILSSDYSYFPKEHIVILVSLSLISLLLLKFNRRPKVTFRIDHKIIIPICLLIYGILLGYWIINDDKITESLRNIISTPAYHYAVPFFMYPILLGIVGVFAIVSIIYIFKQGSNKHTIIIFPIIFLSVLIVGKVMSFININFSDIGYWERRMIPYLWFSASLISPIAFYRFIKFFDKKLYAHNKTRIASRFVFVSVLVVTGTLSTFLSVDYYTLFDSENGFTVEDMHLQSILSSLDPYSTLLTASSRSQEIGEYSNLGYIIGYFKNQIWPSISPELPLNLLNGLNNSAIVMLSDSEENSFHQHEYDRGYVYNNLLEAAPRLEINNPNITLVQIPKLYPPTSNSKMVLVLPNDAEMPPYFAYDFLSLGKYNYTTVKLHDLPTIRKADTIIVTDEKTAYTIADFKEKYNLKFKNLVIFNLAGYENLVRPKEIPLSNLTKMTIVKDEDNKFEINLDKPIYLNNYSFFNLDWNGKMTGNTNKISFLSTSNESIEFTFKDNWFGWKHLVFPMTHLYDKTTFNQSGLFTLKSLHKENYMVTVQKILIQSIDSQPRNDILQFDDFLFSTNAEFHDLSLTKYLEANGLRSHSSEENIKFPLQIPTFPIEFDGFRVHSYYDSGVPFVLLSSGEYEIYYLNLFPLIQSITSDPLNQNYLFPILKESSNMLNISNSPFKFQHTTPRDFVLPKVSTFKDAFFNGNTTIKSVSSIIYLKDPSVAVNIDGKKYKFDNLVSIYPIEADEGIIKGNHFNMTGGIGYYTNITSEASIAEFSGNSTQVSLVFENGKEIDLTGKVIKIESGSSDIMSREPNIISNGTSNFSKFYSYGDLNNELNILGKDLIVDGHISLKITYSDTFTLTQDTLIDGKIIYPEKIYYEKIENFNIFKSTDMKLIAVLLVFLLIYFILSKRHMELK